MAVLIRATLGSVRSRITDWISIKPYVTGKPGRTIVRGVVEVDVTTPIAIIIPDNIYMPAFTRADLRPIRTPGAGCICIKPHITGLPGRAMIRGIIEVCIIIPVTIVLPANIYMSILIMSDPGGRRV